MSTKITFGKQPFVAARCVAEGGSRLELDDALLFERQWRADRTVDVRRFRRSVRAGGTSLGVAMIVVRRKVLTTIVVTPDVNCH